MRITNFKYKLSLYKLSVFLSLFRCRLRNVHGTLYTILHSWYLSLWGHSFYLLCVCQPPGKYIPSWHLVKDLSANNFVPIYTGQISNQAGVSDTTKWWQGSDFPNQLKLIPLNNFLPFKYSSCIKIALVLSECWLSCK